MSKFEEFWETFATDEDYNIEEFTLSPLAKHTDIGWRHILRLCELKRPCGFGALDSFLSGPDLERRIQLVEQESRTNTTLRSELSDTLGLNQSSDWTPEQHERLRNAALQRG
jgi:hypothetical protein